MRRKCLDFLVLIGVVVLLVTVSISVMDLNREKWSGNLVMIPINSLNADIISKFDVVEKYSTFVLVKDTESVRAFLNVHKIRYDAMKDRTLIMLRGRIFDSRMGEPKISHNLRYVDNGDGYVYVILQFIGPVKDAWKRELQKYDVSDFKYAIYIPNFAYIVRVPTGKINILKEKRYIQWIGYYHPQYKLSPYLDERGYPQKVKVLVFRTENIMRVLPNVGKYMKITKYYSTLRYYVIRGIVDSKEDVVSISRIEAVMWIEPQYDYHIVNDKATWVMQSNIPGVRSIHDHGLRGEDQIVTVADTGLNVDHEMFYDPDHPIGPDHRKVKAYFVPGDANGDNTDGQGHGTHVCGTVGGDAPETTGGTDWYTYNKYDGSEFCGYLIMEDIAVGGGMSVWPPSDLWDLFLPARENGSYIHTNSWGGGDGYDSDTARIDEFMWTYKDFLILFAMGNDGPDPNTLSSQPEAKNIISVGACENGYSADNMADFSSRGYADDGRIKPTIVTPGVNIMSADYQDDTGYVAHDGTSMATPGAAGSAALVRQYYMLGYWPTGEPQEYDAFVPSAALIKATMINSAVEINGTGAYQNWQCYPNGDQGWGRLLLDNALYFKGEERKTWIYDSNRTGVALSTGEYREFTIDVVNGSMPLEITLVWTDYPGAPNAAKELVNDLDLTVTDPNGNVFYGNVYTGYNPGYSTTGGDYDRTNVVESVLLLPNYSYSGNLPLGTYKINVSAYNIPSGPQEFALVVSGGIDFVIPGPQVKVIQPNGGEIIESGSVYKIMWNATDPQYSSSLTIDIYYSTDGGNTWNTIATGEANDGEYNWTTPLIDSNTVLIKIEATNPENMKRGDKSDDYFTITEGPVTLNLSVTPNPTAGSTTINITATIDDSSTGGSTIEAAEFFIDSDPGIGNGTPLNPSDGAFDSPTEDVFLSNVDISSLSDGVHKIYVRGKAGGVWGLAEYEELIVGPDALYLQVQSSSISGFLNLTKESMENSVNVVKTDTISSSGDYMINARWISEPFDKAVDIGGRWEFSIYGVLPNNTISGYLYAKVYSYNTGKLLFTTGYDDENVNQSYRMHKYVWSYNVSEYTIIEKGDRIYVEIWIHVDGIATDWNEGNLVTNGEFNGDTSGWTETAIQNDANGGSGYDDTNNAPGGSGGSLYAYVNGQGYLKGYEGYWAQQLPKIYGGSSGNLSFYYKKDLQSNPDYVANMEMKVILVKPDGKEVALWEDTTKGDITWTEVRIDITPHLDLTGTYEIRLYFKVLSRYVNAAGIAYEWFDEVKTDIQIPEAKFALHYDYSNTPSYVAINHEIASSFTLHLYSGWNLVSVPLHISNLWASTLGAKLSDGDIISKWDASNSTYVDWVVGTTPESYDFILEDGYGFWVWCSSEKNITLYGIRPKSTETIEINLVHGWNLVGWLSNDTSKHASDLASYVIGGNATIISRWDAQTQQYEDYLVGISPDSYNFSLVPGEGYWIWVDADCVFKYSP